MQVNTSMARHRLSASRALLATERMLTAFPLQSLTNATAMVEFSRFPASLATAAESYANLEMAVRAAAPPNRGPIFDASNEQMARLDQVTRRQLTALGKALELDVVELSGLAPTFLPVEMTGSPERGGSGPGLTG